MLAQKLSVVYKYTTSALDEYSLRFTVIPSRDFTIGSLCRKSQKQTESPSYAIFNTDELYYNSANVKGYGKLTLICTAVVLNALVQEMKEGNFPLTLGCLETQMTQISQFAALYLEFVVTLDTLEKPFTANGELFNLRKPM